jgi:alpha-tubulin suppressor-like RCC1 family protein
MREKLFSLNKTMFYIQRLIQRAKQIVDISIGNNQCVALSETGRVFLWKKSIAKPFSKPKKVKKSINVKIIVISCGARHSLLLSDDGLIYGICSNELTIDWQ